MTRLIDADALAKVKFHGYPEIEITPSDVNAEAYKRGWNDAIDAIIESGPSIDAVQVKHGIWIEENTRPRSSQFYCSVCHRTAYDPQPTRIHGWVKRCRYAYCPNCGSRMDGEENG